MINTEMLKEKISLSGYRFNWIAKNLGLSPFGLRKKVQGVTEFKVSEIAKISDILNLSYDEREEIFFLPNSDI